MAIYGALALSPQNSGAGGGSRPESAFLMAAFGRICPLLSQGTRPSQLASWGPLPSVNLPPMSVGVRESRLLTVGLAVDARRCIERHKVGPLQIAGRRGMAHSRPRSIADREALRPTIACGRNLVTAARVACRHPVGRMRDALYTPCTLGRRAAAKRVKRVVGTRSSGRKRICQEDRHLQSTRSYVGDWCATPPRQDKFG
jgi:hypothetical protein